MTQDIHDYIAKQIDNGHHPDTIKRILKKQGHPDKAVKGYFEHPTVAHAHQNAKHRESNTVVHKSEPRASYTSTWSAMFNAPEEFFATTENHPKGQPWRFFLKSLLIGLIPYSLLISVLLVLARTQAIGTPEDSFILQVIFGAIIPLQIIQILIGMFIWTFFIWLASKILGQHPTFSSVWKLFCYAISIYLVVLWVPFINILAAVASVVLLIVGLRYMLKISVGRAIGIFFIALVLIIILSVILAFLLAALVIYPFFSEITPAMIAANQMEQTNSFGTDLQMEDNTNVQGLDQEVLEEGNRREQENTR